MQHNIENFNTPLVSVVTPVYNGDKYLAECIESVLGQTYSNWEYIIVNNRSTDNTLQIAEYYAEKDNRIKLYTNDDFLKQVPNWNEALSKISPDSKYCKEIHADDCLMPECIEKLVKKAEKYPSAGIISSYRFVDSKVASVYGKGLHHKTDFFTGKEMGREFMLNSLFLFGTPSTILYRSDLIRAREAFYNPTVVHADTDICYDILQKSDFAFVHQVLSFTRFHEEATTNFADRYNTYNLFRLYAIKEYGNYYLTSEEYEKTLQSKLREEHSWLFKSLLKGRAKEVWPYHKKELERIGLRIEKFKLLKAFFNEASGIVRMDKLRAIKDRISNIFKSTHSNQNAAEVKIIEEKKRDTALSKDETKSFSQ